ncbi:putative E3 ubiquitin-protein ligase UBR1 [Helianthus annuus]|nr:putative E3 ubiquitin-protein ligase UBR1 [Helianthus annuus]
MIQMDTSNQYVLFVMMPIPSHPCLFLILLRKSMVASLLNKHSPSWENEVQRSGKEQVSVNNDTMNNQLSSSAETITSSQLTDLVQNAINEFASTGLPHETVVSFGDAFEENMYTRIVRVMDNDLIKAEDSSNESLLLGKYIASLSNEIMNITSPSETGRSRSNAMKSSVTYDGFGLSDCDGFYVSSCGHAVHQGCLIVIYGH